MMIQIKKLWVRFLIWYGARSVCCHAPTEWDDDYGRMYCSKCKKTNMKTLYCDASFDWNSTEKSDEPFVRGKIGIYGDNSFERIEKVAIGKVEGLKQYINILELTAMARAVELASEENPKADALTIYTDSQTAMYWARNNKINPKVATLAHDNALEYLRRAHIQFGGEITFNHILRDKNPAGKLLEAELEKEPPHTI